MAKQKMQEAPASVGRPAKYEFFQRLEVGEKVIVSTAGMTTMERLRTLRSLRTRKSQMKSYYGRDFDVQQCKVGIEVKRVA